MDRLVFFEGVYAPAEDSELLLKALEDEQGDLLEVGCGSGFVSIGYALMKKGTVECCDINVLALKNVAWNALMAGVKVVTFYSDLFENVHKKYDIIAFNPPYLDNITGDDATEDNGSLLEYVKVVKRYLKLGGRAYVLISTANSSYRTYVEELRKDGWKLLMQRELFFERLEVWRLKT